MDFRSQPLKFSIEAFGKIHPTIIAGFEGHWNIVRLLLADERTDIPILRNMDGWLLRLACMNNQADAVKMILEDRDLRVNQLNHQGRMPWFPYVFGPHKKSHLLINKPGLNGTTVFMTACFHGTAEGVKLLMQNQSVDVNKTNQLRIDRFS